MAVYTQVTHEQLNAFWQGFDLPKLTGFAGISEGTANTNYRVETEGGLYILTLYEKRTDPADLPFFLGLMQHLAVRGLVCPAVIPARNGSLTGILCGRPAAVTTFLAGQSVSAPQPAHCGELGAALALMHLAGRDFSLQRTNPLSLYSWQQQATMFAGPAETIEVGLGQTVQDEASVLSALWPQELPRGVVHADLFPDNAFFKDRKISGVIDFYYACNDFWAYDLAVCLNAWCFDENLAFDPACSRALLGGYHDVRPLVPAEWRALPVLCRGAALNFTLMRLGLWFDAQPYRERDPRDYLKRLLFHQQVQNVGGYGL